MSTLTNMVDRTRIDRLRSLWRDHSGLALLEFAFSAPLVLAVGGWGVELSNLALDNLRVSQYALNLADNATRVGQAQVGGVTNFREVDANDVLQGAKLEGSSLNLTTYGRITISSLENVQQSYDQNGPVQRIHWQRCIGAMNGTLNGRTWDSNYGTVSTTAGSDGSQANAGLAVPTGMGDAGYKVTAPTNTGVIFVEVNYLYKPLFGSFFVTPQMLHYTASYLVRDNRSFVQVYNPAPTAVASTCDKHLS